MPTPNPAALEFLQSRRSRPAKTLEAPVPTRAELLPILTAAARTPDHGKLEPWRFVVFEKAALKRLSDAVHRHGPQSGEPPEKVDKMASQFGNADLAVMVVSSPKASEKIPEIEQVLSSGAVCLALVNAALASGWGANWLTGWAVHDRAFRETHLGLEAHETVAGMIHLGTERVAPPDRPRPDLGAITTWIDA